MIDIIVPVLGRPGNAAPLAESLAASGADAQLTFVCTPGDRHQIQACRATGADVIVATWRAGRGDYAKKINLGFRRTDAPFLFNGADDIQFTPGWAQASLSMMADGIAVVATNDKAHSGVKSGQFGTHNLIRRTYIDEEGGTADNKPGVVLYEGYDHWYVDVELCGVARSRGKFVAARHSIVRHRHPIWKTASDDATYRKGQAHAREDHNLHLQRMKLWAPKLQRDIVAR